MGHGPTRRSPDRNWPVARTEALDPDQALRPKRIHHFHSLFLVRSFRFRLARDRQNRVRQIAIIQKDDSSIDNFSRQA